MAGFIKNISLFCLIVIIKLNSCKSKLETEIDMKDNIYHKVFGLKFIVPSGMNYTFSHELNEGETLSVNFAVVQNKIKEKLGINFLLIDEGNGEILVNILNKDSVQLSEISGEDGTFSLCFANEDDLINDKTIIFYMYMNSFKSYNWKNSDSEIAKLNVVAKKFKESFANTEDKIERAIKFIMISRLNADEDLALLEYTNNNVNNLAFLNCLIIGIVGIFQVYFVKTLFDIEAAPFKFIKK